MMPPAPDLFSITKVLPRTSAILAVITRATISTAPPAGNGRIRRIGLSGYSAKDGAGTARTSANAASTTRANARVISASLTEIELHRGSAEYLVARGAIRHAIGQPVDGRLVAELPLVADEGAIARPHQPV